MNKVFQEVNIDKLAKMLAIKKEHESGNISTEEAKKRMQEEVGKISPEEFAAAEQLLKEENPEECRNEDVRTMLDIFDGLIPDAEPELAYGHPIDAYRRENEKLKEILLRGDELLKKQYIKNEWLEIMESIISYKIHFSRKQNQLYSILEKKGFDRPTTTMWPYDDEIRDEMNRSLQALKDDDQDTFFSVYKEMVTDVRDLMSKEELILYPTSLKLISEEEFEEMKSGDREIGFFMIDMPEYEKGNGTQKVEKDTNDNFMVDLSNLLGKYGLTANANTDEVLDVAEGKLTLEQINLIFRHLPVDISYVDENEIVKFYTDTPHRVFPRSKGVIGREVKNCHPPKSVHLVEEIIEKFRNGEQETVDFWINKPDLFIYIKYVAVRDANGKFRGVLEMMQDCTRIRSVEGSRTLLTWEEENGDDDARDETIITNEAKEPNGEIILTPNTKLKDLLQRYPRLKEDLPTINPKFKMLSTPIAKVILPKATIEMMSERSEMPLEELLTKLQALIDTY